MKILVSALLLALLTGCANTSRKPPVDVLLMPTDCANRTALINWYTTQLNLPRQSLESKEEYELYQAQVRYRMWHLRYTCEPV